MVSIGLFPGIHAEAALVLVCLLTAPPFTIAYLTLDNKLWSKLRSVGENSTFHRHLSTGIPSVACILPVSHIGCGLEYVDIPFLMMDLGRPRAGVDCGIFLMPLAS